MATGFQAFAADLPNGEHNLGSDMLKVMLTNTAPNASTHAVKADLTEISAGNGYTAGGQTVSVTSSTQTAGTYNLVADIPIINASGGSIGPFRYAVLYNDTNATDKLISFYDYGSSVTVLDGESFDFDEVTAGSLFTFSV